ncbi:MAG TPA: sugar ABC transporter ATP-binding protein [Streptosporangiaceae bacterium]|nr:sugar ABC transporter ATP-binding protein [Streptosporangiaceae bacterium]
MTASLVANGVSKTFGTSKVLVDIDLTVDGGSVHALLGQNGSGKSTFIKILSGYHRPDPGGEVRVGGRELHLGTVGAAHALGARFVHQELGLVDSLSITDNLALGSGFPVRYGTIMRASFDASATEDLAVVGLDVNPQMPVERLSPAERMLVAMARALRAEKAGPVTLLVLDEVTAALAKREVERVMTAIKTVTARGVGVLYVTHRLQEVIDLADEVTVLRDGHRDTQAKVSGLDKASLVRLLVGHEVAEPGRQPPPVGPRIESEAMTVRGLKSPSLHGVDLQIRAGEVVGIAGLMGSGREDLLGTIFGVQRPSAGSVAGPGFSICAGKPRECLAAGIAYVSHSRQLSTAGSLTARENLTLGDLSAVWRPPLLRHKRERAETLVWFRKLGVSPGDAVDRPLWTFSGGNQQKIAIARWLRCRPRVLLIDEPSQGVDAEARAGLHDLLLGAAREGAAVVTSSSDVEELVGLCDRVLVMRDGRVAAEVTERERTTERVTSLLHGPRLAGVS